MTSPARSAAAVLLLVLGLSGVARAQDSDWRSFVSVSPVFEEADLDAGGVLAFTYIPEQARRAKAASRILARLSTAQRDAALLAAADLLVDRADEVLDTVVLPLIRTSV